MHYALRNVNDYWSTAVRYIDIIPTAGPIDSRDSVLKLAPRFSQL